MKAADIIASLKPICDAYKASGVVHKYKAYRNCIDALKDKYGAEGEIKDVSELNGVKGIGTGMKEKITELLKTGQLQQSTNVKQDPQLQALELFTSVHGVGPVLARKLVYEQKLKTIEDLRQENVYKTLPAVVHLGLKYWEDSQEKIPFNEVEEIVEQVSKVVRENVDARLRAVCCGSHRRLVPFSGDVDILLTHPFTHSTQQYSYLSKTVRALKKDGIVLEDSLAEGSTKFMGYTKLKVQGGQNNNKVRRIDIRWMPSDHFFAALMYFTGSAAFNIRCRVAANEKGFTLNEMGLWKASSGARREREDDDVNNNKTSPNKQDTNNNSNPGASSAKELVLVPKCEADLFTALGIGYLKPHERTH